MKLIKTQIKFSIASDLKQQAQKKAQGLGVELEDVLEIFLTKFSQKENIFKIQAASFNWEEIFDQAAQDYFLSPKAKQSARLINDLLS